MWLNLPAAAKSLSGTDPEEEAYVWGCFVFSVAITAEVEGVLLSITPVADRDLGLPIPDVEGMAISSDSVSSDSVT